MSLLGDYRPQCDIHRISGKVSVAATPVIRNVSSQARGVDASIWSAMRRQATCCNMPVSHRSPNAVVRNPGYIGDTVAPSSCDKALSNGPENPFGTPSGHVRFISSNVKKVNLIRWWYAHWLLNGSASSSDAGRITSLMTRLNTQWRSKTRALPYSINASC